MILILIRYLLRQPGIDIEAKDTSGETALHLASSANEAEAIVCLVRAGANVNSPNQKSMIYLNLFFLI